MALVNVKFQQRKWILKCYWKKREYEISTKITQPNAIRLYYVGCSEECFLLLKTMYTARPEALN
jgi:hypothetical protein